MTEAEKEAGPITATYINPKLPSMIRDLYRADLRERSIQNMLDLAADLVQELIDLRAEQGACTPQPTEDDREYDPDLAAFLSQSLDDEPMWSCVVIAKNLHAAGFRRAPQPRADRAIRALSTERGDPRGPEPVRFDPPLTRAEADAFWDAITDQTESPVRVCSVCGDEEWRACSCGGDYVPESPDQDQQDRSK